MIYLDNSATTKPCAEAVEAITKSLTEGWGNPSALYNSALILPGPCVLPGCR